MIRPQRAPVQPRIVLPETGEALPLALYVADLLNERHWRVVEIVGGPGAGKTTALEHLAAELDVPDLLLLDEPPIADVAACAAARRVIFTGQVSHAIADVRLSLAPWGADELHEYLWAMYRERCSSVLAFVRADPDRAALAGNPALWRLILDAMATEPGTVSIRQASEQYLAGLLTTNEQRNHAAAFSLGTLLGQSEEAVRALEALTTCCPAVCQSSLLKHPFARQILAGEQMAAWLIAGEDCPPLGSNLPPGLLAEMRQRVPQEPGLVERLSAILQQDVRRLYHAQAATLLHAANPDWRPSEARRAFFSGGSFRQAAWAGVKLGGGSMGASQFVRADLSEADLRGSVFDGARLRKANLSHARLEKASLVGVQGEGADFHSANLTEVEADRIDLRRANLQRASVDGASLIGADFDEADLREASFANAKLRYSVLIGCELAGADFRGADLHGSYMRHLKLREVALAGARLREADLSYCDLEGVVIEQADFFKANLQHAYLTASVMPGADFRRAKLSRAGLAEIEWPNADLREADLRGCTFHMGSTRSGLVGSPYPGHGSKTGFYTDDYYDQGYKAPEEIRKANLCGADLRGAKLDGVDFYLVDLRGALFDPDVEEQLVRSGAILKDRFPEPM